MEAIIIRLRLIIVRIEPNTLGSIQIPYGELTYLSAASSAPSGGLVMVYVGKLTEVALRPNTDRSWGSGVTSSIVRRLLGSAQTRDQKEEE